MTTNEAAVAKWFFLAVIGIALAVAIASVGSDMAESKNIESCLNHNGKPNTNKVNFVCEVK